MKKKKRDLIGIYFEKKLEEFAFTSLAQSMAHIATCSILDGLR